MVVEVVWLNVITKTGKPYQRRWINTVDLLVLNSSDKQLLVLIFPFSFYKTIYPNEVNCTEPPTESVPWWNLGSTAVWPNLGGKNS
jgi:hypothetical protein